MTSDDGKLTCCKCGVETTDWNTLCSFCMHEYHEAKRKVMAPVFAAVKEAKENFKFAEQKLKLAREVREKTSDLFDEEWFRNSLNLTVS